jgi:hypothetical protein
MKFLLQFYDTIIVVIIVAIIVVQQKKFFQFYESDRKGIGQKVTSGQITDEKVYATNAFLWQNFVICFFRSFRADPTLVLN